MSKIMIIGSHPEQLLNFRGDLIRHLQRRGHQVVTATPPGPVEVDNRFASWGVRRIDLSMDRTGVSILADLRLTMQMAQLMREERPDAVLSYTIKPVVYGAIAARFASRPAFVALITGLGLAFSPAASAKERAVRWFARTLYKIAMRCTDIVIFQNPDDETDFRKHWLLTNTQRVEVTAGSGINLQRFERVPLPAGKFRFVMVARLLADKGVREYIAAAASVRSLHPEVEFHLIGPFDPNPSAISSNEIEAAVAAGSIVYQGFILDVRPHLAACHVYVLPSYREGTPRSVLEALAIGRPVITTDAPGCRETVEHGVNGFLVTARSTEPLARAMIDMITATPDTLMKMADASRHMAETRFDVNWVNAQMTAALEGVARVAPSQPVL